MKNRKALIGMAVLFLAIGFATISTTLVVNGILALGESDDFEIIFTSAKLDGRKRNDFISSDKKHIEFTSNTLTDIDDETKLVYEVTNTSRNYDANVSVRCTSGENEYIMFNYTPLEMRVLAGETKSGTLTASMLKVTDIERDIPIECTLTAEATERESLGDEYIEPFSRSGVLKKTTIKHYGFMDDRPIGDFWDYKTNVTDIIFEDKMIAHETVENLIFDVSAAADKSVMAYLIENDKKLISTSGLESTTAYTLYIQSESGVKANSDSSYLFANFTNLTSIEGFEFFDTSNTKSMCNMFANLNNIEVIDVSNFDTSNVTNMYMMFMSGPGTYAPTRALKEIKGIEYFDTSNVTDMSRMFTGLPLEELNIYEWDVSNVKYFGHMFSFCTKLKKAPVTNWNLSSATDFTDMFWSSVGLEEVIFNYSGATKLGSFYQMFFNCTSLKSIKINFDTSNVGSFYQTFANCNKLTNLDITNISTSNANNMMSMFNGCNSLVELNVSNFDTSKVTDMSQMFHGCNNLKTLDVSNFNTSNVKNFSSMFQYCTNLSVLDLSNFNTESAINMGSMFFGCSNLTTLDIGHFDTSNVTNMSSMFWHCDNLTSLDVSRWNTSNVTNMTGMFAYCGNLEALDVSNWNTSNVTDMSSMFGYLRKVDTLDVSNWDTSKVTTMRAMFVECNELKSLNLDNWDLTNVTNLNSFVSGCHILNTTITIRGTNCTNYAGENGYWAIFFNAATNGNIIVNYTVDASSLVDEMIATKSDYSKVYKGVEVA